MVLLHNETVYIAVYTNVKVCGIVVPSTGKFSYNCWCQVIISTVVLLEYRTLLCILQQYKTLLLALLHLKYLDAK